MKLLENWQEYKKKSDDLKKEESELLYQLVKEIKSKVKELLTGTKIKYILFPVKNETIYGKECTEDDEISFNELDEELTEDWCDVKELKYDGNDILILFDQDGVDKRWYLYNFTRSASLVGILRYLEELGTQEEFLSRMEGEAMGFFNVKENQEEAEARDNKFIRAFFDAYKEDDFNGIFSYQVVNFKPSLKVIDSDDKWRIFRLETHNNDINELKVIYDELAIKTLRNDCYSEFIDECAFATPLAIAIRERFLTFDQGEAMGFFNVKENVNESNVSTLINAIKKNDTETVKDQISKGVDVNEFKNLYTPLMTACAKYNYDIIKLLLDNGADPNIKNKFGSTALFYAVTSNLQEENFSEENQIKIVNLLIEHDAKVSEGNEKMQTSCHIAANYGNYKLLTILLDAGSVPYENGNGDKFWSGKPEIQKWVNKNYPHLGEGDAMGFYSMKN